MRRTGNDPIHHMLLKSQRDIELIPAISAAHHKPCVDNAVTWVASHTYCLTRCNSETQQMCMEGSICSSHRCQCSKGPEALLGSLVERLEALIIFFQRQRASTDWA